MRSTKKEFPVSIDFRGRMYNSPKTGSKLSAHFYSEDEALERLKPHLEKVGITRLANITGLDRTGIPVVNSIKPTINGFCVQHGKGMTLKSAKISAAMESFERYYGTAQDIPSFRMSYRELEKKYNVIPYERLALSKDSIFHPDLEVDWTLGWDIVNREEVAVPRESVMMSRDIVPGELRLFQMNSNGLSAGFDFLETVSQALLEDIERDAVTCNMHAAKAVFSPFPLKRVRLDTIQNAEIRRLYRQVEEAGVFPVLFDCRIDTKVPTFKCYLFDKLEPGYGICYGMGASLEPDEALARAVNEASQPRAIFNSGARDIFFHEEFRALKLTDFRSLINTLEQEEGDVDVSDIESEAAETFEEDIAICTEKLKAVGLHQVIVFRLTEPGNEIVGVKVVVPGLEGYMLDDYTPGVRAQMYLGGKEL